MTGDHQDEVRIVTLLPLVALAACAAGCASQLGSLEAEEQSALSCSSVLGAGQNPLLEQPDPISVEPLSLEDLPGPVDEFEPNTVRSAGVALGVPAQPGWTRPWLERRLLCYRATAGLSPDDPLLVPAANLRVVTRTGYFIVAVTSEDAAVAAQIEEAASRLPSRAPIATSR